MRAGTALSKSPLQLFKNDTKEHEATMSVTDELLANNAAYAESFSGPLPLPPAMHVAVLACMDARLNPYGVLGLAEGDAHVIRNAGSKSPPMRSAR
jgi:carbonic anhydrase